MKRLLSMLTAITILSAAGAAQAQINVDIGLGEGRPVYAPQPVYVAPRPEYYPVYGRDKHSRVHDYDYWREHDAHHDDSRNFHHVEDDHRR